MKCTKLLLPLAACLALCAAEAEPNPFDFLFSRCDDDGDAAVSGCIRQLLRDSLDRSRPKFATGLQVGEKTVVLEPWKMPKPEPSDGRSSSSSTMKIEEAQLEGLSQVQIDSVMLTDSQAAARVEFPQLHGEMRGKIKYGFLPIRATLKVELLKPQLMVAARWSVRDGQLQLEEPNAQLWLDGYNVTISGFGSMGRNMADNLNDNHKEIIEFLTPSLEAAVVRRINKLDQEERNAALRWLEKALG